MSVGKDPRFSDSSMDITLELAAFMWNIQDNNVLLSGSFLVVNLLLFVNCFLGNRGPRKMVKFSLYLLSSIDLEGIV